MFYEQIMMHAFALRLVRGRQGAPLAFWWVACTAVQPALDPPWLLSSSLMIQSVWLSRYADPTFQATESTQQGQNAWFLEELPLKGFSCLLAYFIISIMGNNKICYYFTLQGSLWSTASLNGNINRIISLINCLLFPPTASAFICWHLNVCTQHLGSDIHYV